MTIGKACFTFHRLRSLEFFDEKGNSIGGRQGFFSNEDRVIEFTLEEGERIIGFKKQRNRSGRCADFQFIIASK